MTDMLLWLGVGVAGNPYAWGAWDVHVATVVGGKAEGQERKKYPGS
jgi:hypothetical protein